MKKKSVKSHAKFFFVGIFAFVLSFIGSYIFFGDNKNQSFINQENIKQPEKDIYNNFNALINKITSESSCEIYNIDTESNSIINLTNATEILDKNNFHTRLNNFKPGDLVNISALNGQIKSICANKKAWEQNRLVNFKIDLADKNIIFNNQEYYFNNNTLVLYKNHECDIKKLNDLCMISLKGLDKNIWTIEINKSTGVLCLIDFENKITNGNLKIDNKNLIELNKITSKILTEGPHTISITGDNIQTYKKDIFIEPDENFNINFSDLQIKCGLLELKLNINNCIVHIDNARVYLTEPILLAYGSHKLKISKENYKDYEKDIFINQDTCELNINLEKIINMSRVRVMSNPIGAKVYLDDAYIGETPVECLIEYGNHNINLSKQNYGTVNLPIEINKSYENFSVNLIRLETPVS